MVRGLIESDGSSHPFCEEGAQLNAEVFVSMTQKHLDWIDERIANSGSQAVALNGSVWLMNSAAASSCAKIPALIFNLLHFLFHYSAHGMAIGLLSPVCRE